MKTKILADFQICISLPLTLEGKIELWPISKKALNNTHMDISSFSTDEVTTDVVNSVIKSLDANKAPGTDKYQ